MSPCPHQAHALGWQVSYAIGVAQPLSVHVDTYGTGTIPDKQILAKVLKKFDFRPGAPCPLYRCALTPNPHPHSPNSNPFTADLPEGRMLP